MTELEHKNEFLKLKANLYKNYVIFHERVTFLAEIKTFDIQNTRVKFKLKYVKPLDSIIDTDEQSMHDWMKQKDISVSSPYLLSENGPPLLKNGVLCRAYCPFIIWFDPEFAKFAAENDASLTSSLPRYLFEYLHAAK